MIDLFILLFMFQIKHFICDYPLQNAYMLGKAKEFNWKIPLLAHAGVHAIGTFLVAFIFIYLFSSSFIIDIFLLSLLLGSIDLILHFIVDRIKASPDLGGRFKPDQPYFWWALGLDQMAHHLINYSFVLCIILKLNLLGE